MNENQLSEQWKQFQTEWQEQQEELTELAQKSSTLVKEGRANDALVLAQKGQDGVNAYYQKWESWLQNHAANTPFVTSWNQQIAEMRGELLWDMGLALWYVGRLDEAYSDFNSALLAFEGQSSPFKASLLQGLGGICQQQELFGEAEEYYQRAYDEFASLAESFQQQPESVWQNFVSQFRTEAARTLSYAADNAISQGKRGAFLNYLDNAINFAERHNLDAVMHELWLKKLSYRLDTDPTGETAQELSEDLSKLKSLTQDVTLQINALRALAQYWSERGSLNMAYKQLRNACDMAMDSPEKMWVLLDLAGVCEAQAQEARIKAENCTAEREIGEARKQNDLAGSLLDSAVKYSEDALKSSRKTGMVGGMVELVPIILRTLIPLRLKTGNTTQRELAEKDMGMLREVGNHQELVNTLLMRALIFSEQKSFDLALQDVEEAQQYASTLELRLLALLAKTAILRKMQRAGDALTVNREAIALINEQLVPGGVKSLTEWRSLLSAVETLYESAAFLSAELGQIHEAFEFAESGKALGLRSQLERVGLETNGVEKLTHVTFDTLRDLLAPESSALAMYCVTGHGTLVILVDPREQNPLCQFIDVKEDDLLPLLPKDKNIPLEWDSTFLRAISKISSKLLLPLQNVVENCNVLYLVPDSRLYVVPFAALTFDSGKSLIDYCALAYVPSAAVLKWCQSRQVINGERTCLAVGFGNEGQFSFVEQARNVATHYLWGKREYLLDKKATAAQFLRDAKNFTVLHVACHGIVDPAALGTLSASRLELADFDHPLTAKDVFQLGGQLHAELVFLNACMSGQFHIRLGSEVGGFWQAFLNAGATSLITTLVSVDPEAADKVTHEFYSEWLNGDITKAEALRRAQLKVYAQYKEPLYWASHILVGDHR